MPKKSKDEQKHIVGYTIPHGHNGATYPVYDYQGYIKYGLKKLGHIPPSRESGPIVINKKKVVISFD